MERGERRAEENYEKLIGMIPEAQEVLHEEEVHERKLANLLDEERLNYISSMVLGLNDALVELTGALAGLTFALQNTKLTGITALIIGISAAFSMSASEYLSTRSEGDKKSPLKAAFYTGVAYLMTVIILVWPYFVFSYYILAFGVALLGALTIILVFTFFVSVVQEKSFLRFFLEMFFVSFGVAVFSFSVGILARKIFNVEV